MKHHVAHHNVAMDQIYAGRKNFNLRTKLREISFKPGITGFHTPNLGRGDLRLFYLEFNGLSGARSGHT